MRTRSPYCKRAPRLLGVAANMPWNRAVTSAGDAMAGDAMAMRKIRVDFWDLKVKTQQIN